MTEMVNPANVVISLPMPLYLLVEDVGWWQGFDGSASQEPYRNNFCRRHCLADYEALASLAKTLGMRIGLGMVLGEWDRLGCLKDVPGATWQGPDWTNAENRGSWLDQAAAFLNDNREYLEIGLHGLCHEFWQDGKMERSEFHDRNGRMRSPDIVHRHLRGYADLLAQNNLGDYPRLFVPPALNHSFGNGPESFQAILAEYGIRYVITRFSRARQYSPPLHERMTWEEGVVLLERGDAPVSWDVPATSPPGHIPGPILPLHWGNLLHPNPERNDEAVNVWARAIGKTGSTMSTVLARDVADCFRQAAACSLGKISTSPGSMEIDLRGLPQYLSLSGSVRIKVKGHGNRPFTCLGGKILECMEDINGIQTIEVLPDPHLQKIQLLV